MNYYPNDLHEGVVPVVYTVNAIDEDYHSDPGTLFHDERKLDASGAPAANLHIMSMFDAFMEVLKSTSAAQENQVAAVSAEESAQTITQQEYMRFVPVSKRHAFPPSKDPTGTYSFLPGISGVDAGEISTVHPGRKDGPNNFIRRIQQQHTLRSGVATKSQTSEATSASSTNSHYGDSDPLTNLLGQDTSVPKRKMTAEELFSSPPPDSITVRPETVNSTAFSATSNTSPPKQSMSGILPKDWLEKHAQWLPSVVLVVSVLDLILPHSRRVERDKAVTELIEMLRAALAPKRECRIHLVCLVINHEHLKSAQQKYHIESGHLTNLRGMARLAPSSVSLIHIPTPPGGNDEESSDAASFQPRLLDFHNLSHGSMFDLTVNSQTMIQLIRTVRNMSIAYYLASARRVKRKLSSLTNAMGANAGAQQGDIFTMSAVSVHNHHLLPMAIRYHFKIGIYYEFQGKIDKGQRHFQEAYGSVELYYRFIVNQQRNLVLSKNNLQKQHQHLLTGDASIAPPTQGTFAVIPTTSPVPPPTTTIQSNSEDGDEIGVEVCLDGDEAIASQQAVAEIDKDQYEEEDSDFMGMPNEHFAPPQTKKNQSASGNSDSLALTAPVIRHFSSDVNNSMDLGFVTAMAHQCRGVADWIHLKLMLYDFQRQQLIAKLQASEALLDHVDSNPLASAASQWRRHCQTFLSSTYYYRSPHENDVCFEDEKADEHMDRITFLQPLWLHWSQIARQRFVMAQISEIYRIPQFMGAPIYMNLGEVLMTCCSWRLYESAAEATLQTLIELRRLKTRKTISSGQLSHDTLPLLNVHADEGGIYRFVGSMDRERLRQELLVELEKDHEKQSIEHLEKAALLFYEECKHFLPESENPIAWETPSDPPRGRLCARIHYLAGNLYLKQGKHVDARQHLLQALRQAILWPALEVEIVRSLSQCFPADFKEDVTSTDALLRSIIKIMLRTDTSHLIPPKDIQSLTNVVIHLWTYTGSKSAIHVKWPEILQNLSPLSFEWVFMEDSAFATAGDVIAACLLVQSHVRFQIKITQLQVLMNSSVFNGQLIDVPVQKSGVTIAPHKEIAFHVKLRMPPTSALPPTNVIGNRPVSYREVSVALSPTYQEGIDKISLRLTVPCRRSVVRQKARFADFVKRKDVGDLNSNVNKRRYEDDNYVMTSNVQAGDNPRFIGPMCLQLATPRPEIRLENVTGKQTASKAMDGTVNRIYFKIKAGEDEICKNLKLVFSSFSNTHFSHAAYHREATLVLEQSGKEDGLPVGWRRRTLEESTTVCTHLGPSQTHLFYFDVYRPMPSTEIGISDLAADICVSEYKFELSYEQSRLKQGVAGFEGENVKFVYASKLEWSSPFTAKFSQGNGLAKKSFPCGSQHPMNKVLNESQPEPLVDNEFYLVDEEKISLTCTLRAPESQHGLVPEILSLVFQPKDRNVDGEVGTVEIIKQSTAGVPGTCNTNTKWRALKAGTDLTTAFTLKVYLGESKSDKFISKTSQYEVVRVSLGTVKIDWCPDHLEFNTSEAPGKERNLRHGPLKLDSHEPLVYIGPTVKVERVPFTAGLLTFSHSSKVAVPFEVKYWIRNNTQIPQALSVLLDDSMPSQDANSPSQDNMLVSGMVNGEILLGPQERSTFGYSALALRAGITKLPSLKVSSSRYDAWVIRDGVDESREVFILP